MGIFDSAAKVAQGATVMGAAIYAYGWYFLSIVLSEWSLSPEDVGVSFSFLVVRIAPLVILLLGPVYLLRSWQKKRPSRSLKVPGRDATEGVPAPQPVTASGVEERSAESQDWDGWDIAIIGFVYLLAAGALMGAFQWVLETFFDVEDGERFMDDNSWLYAVFLLLPGALLFIGMLTFFWWEDFRAKDHTINLGAFLTAIVFLASVALVGALAYAPFLARDAVVKDVEAGRSANLGLPFLSLLSFREVGLGVDGDVTTEDCVVMFGIGNGLAVFFDPTEDQVVQIPVGRVIIEDGCDAEDG